MASTVQSFGSTTAVQIEDDASSELQIQEGFDEHDGDGYETPNGQCDMPYCGLNTLLARHSIVGY